MRLKWILGLWGAVSLLFFAAFMIAVKSAGGELDQKTQLILSFLAVSLGAWPAARAARFGDRRSPLSYSAAGGLIMVYFGTLLLMAGAYIAATLPGGIASLRLWATPEGNAVLAGAILILAGLTVAVKRGSA